MKDSKKYSFFEYGIHNIYLFCRKLLLQTEAVLLKHLRGSAKEVCKNDFF